MLDAAQLNDNETAAALTTALRAADLLAPDVLRGEAFSTTRSEAMDGNDAAWTQADTILQNLQQWLDQCQARPDTISLPDERGVGYKPATAIELDALATGQQLWQVLQPAATDQNIDQQLLQRLQAMSSFLDWIDSVNRVSAQTGSENGGNGEAAQNA